MLEWLFDASDRSWFLDCWLDYCPSWHVYGWTNAWNDNNTHRHRCQPRVSHLDTSACPILCHSFQVIFCHQMHKNLKMWWTKRVERVAWGYSCVPLNFCDAAWPWPLTYDPEKWISSGSDHYQCVCQIWEQSIQRFLSYHLNTITAGSFDIKLYIPWSFRWYKKNNNVAEWLMMLHHVFR